MFTTAGLLSLLLPILSFSTGVSSPSDQQINPFPVITEERPIEVAPPAMTAPVEQPKKIIRVTATAYSSDVRQTDTSPTITASGSTTRMGVIAANDLPFGTRVRLPGYFGDQIFIVEDRMNARYGSGRVDVWLPSTPAAKQFGVRELAMEILP